MTKVEVAPDTGNEVGIGRSLPEGTGTAAVLATAWLALIVASTINRSDFLSQQTLLAIGFTMSVVGVLAVGQALVAMSGGILDLSLPASLVIPSYVGVQLLRNGVPTGVVVVAVVAVGGVWGSLNATIIVLGKINPIIVTLATNFIGIAVLFLLFNSVDVPSSSALRDFGRGTTLGLPNIFWPMVLIIAVAGFLVPRTRYGRRLIAVGGNAQAAKARGVSLPKTRFAIFIACGACAGLSAVLFLASNANFTPNAGNSYLLQVVSAVILAGIMLSGGRGNIWVLLLSVGFLSTVPTALVFFGLQSDWQLVFQGGILVAAVALDGYRRKQGPA